MYDYIIVGGAGKTTRPNVEALVDDYIYFNPEIKFILYPESALSEAQTWLKQYLIDKKVEHQTTDNLDFPLEKSAMFLLWDEADVKTKLLLEFAEDKGIPVFDLTNGLVQLSTAVHVPDFGAPKPVEYPVEKVSEPVEKHVNADAISEVIENVARLFAEAFASELKKALLK